MPTIPLYAQHLTHEEGRCFDEWIVKRLSRNLWDFACKKAQDGKFILTNEAATELQNEVLESLNQYIAELQDEREVWGE